VLIKSEIVEPRNLLRDRSQERGSLPFPHGRLWRKPHRLVAGRGAQARPAGSPWVARGLLSPASRSYLPTRGRNTVRGTSTCMLSLHTDEPELPTTSSRYW
jgi:hypothetical protein